MALIEGAVKVPDTVKFEHATFENETAFDIRKLLQVIRVAYKFDNVTLEKETALLHVIPEDTKLEHETFENETIFGMTKLLHDIVGANRFDKHVRLSKILTVLFGGPLIVPANLNSVKVNISPEIAAEPGVVRNIKRR